MGLVSSAKAQSTGPTNSVSTTGADLFVVAISFRFGTAPNGAIDNLSNSYTLAGIFLNAGFGVNTSLYYCENPTTSGTTNWSDAIGTTPQVSVTALAWQTGLLSGIFDSVSAGGDGVFTGSAQPGSITPANANNLLIATVSQAASAADATINSGYTVQEFATETGGGGNLGDGLAYLVQAAATAQNPTWTSSGVISTIQACFNLSGGGGSTSLKRNAALNGLSASGPFFRDPLAGYRTAERERRQTFCEQVRRAA